MMFVHSGAILVLAGLIGPIALASATSSTFSYDSSAPNGPRDWAKLSVPENECSSFMNSPIDISASACTDFATYTLEVGSVSHF